MKGPSHKRNTNGSTTYLGSDGRGASKQAERLRGSCEQLRALAAHLQSAREDERSLISREIHDELGAMLTGLKIDLSSLAAGLSVGETTLLQKTKAMIKLVVTIMQKVRWISSALRPGMLDDLGLLAATEWQVQEFQERTGTWCRITSNLADKELDREVSTAVFRILQETLTNVARHADATRVKIALNMKKNNSLILVVEDNGKGITEREIASRKSLGLMGMRERALILGGGVTIVGLPGKGTTVTLHIPLNRH